MKKISVFLATIFTIQMAVAQGSGYNVNLDGTNDYVKISGTDADNYGITPTFTMEAWVRPSSLSTSISCITAFSSWSLASLDRGIVFGLKSTGIYFHIWNGNTFVFRNYTIAATISTTEYSHVAITKSGSNLNFYLNGVLLSTQTNCDNYTSTSNLNATIGAERYNSGGSKYFNGDIDEVRIWNYAKTQAELRNGMCQKETPSTSGLLTYYRFDESTGTTTSDQGTVGANGTLTNLAMSGATSNRILSKAPIGDQSTHLYTSSWTGQTVGLSSASNGAFEVNTVAGVPNGVHVYRVDELPNSTTGTVDVLSTSTTYFGTFIVNGTAPTYTAVYDYNSYSEAITDEDLIGLYFRDHNADPDWIDLVADQDYTANTLTETGVSQRGEFMLTQNKILLPIQLIDFTATYVPNQRVVRLNWTTLTELNSDYFTIEKTTDGINYEFVGEVDGSGNSSQTQQYQLFDVTPTMGWSYYRLRQTDFNGDMEYSSLESVYIGSDNTNGVSVYPNPSTMNDLKIHIQSKEEKDVEIQLFNELGQLINGEKLVSITEHIYKVNDLLKDYHGMLFCHVKIGDQQTVYKISIL